MKLVELKVIVVVDDNDVPQQWIANAIGENLDYEIGEDILSVGVVSIQENYVRPELCAE